MRLIEGLIEVFGRIWRMIELFWDLWKAWLRCLKVYEGWLSSSGTNGRLSRRVWRDWMGGRAILGPIKGLANVFEGIGWEADLFWDLWRAWPTSLKGLDESPTCSGTYRGLGRCVWRGWMGGRRVMGSRAVLRLMEGLANMFKGVGWEADVLWNLWRAWRRGCMGDRRRLFNILITLILIGWIRWC